MRLARARYCKNDNLYNRKMRVWEGRLTCVKGLHASHCTASVNLHGDSTHYLCHDQLPAANGGRDRKSGNLDNIFDIRGQNLQRGIK